MSKAITVLRTFFLCTIVCLTPCWGISQSGQTKGKHTKTMRKPLKFKPGYVCTKLRAGELCFWLTIKWLSKLQVFVGMIYSPTGIFHPTNSQQIIELISTLYYPHGPHPHWFNKWLGLSFRLFCSHRSSIYNDDEALKALRRGQNISTKYFWLK